MESPCLLFDWTHQELSLGGLFGFWSKFILLSKNRSAMSSRPLIPLFHGISSDPIAIASELDQLLTVQGISILKEYVSKVTGSMKDRDFTI